MSSNNRILMAVCNYFNPDNRAFRAANALQSAGYEVVVLSYHKIGLSEEENPGNGFKVRRLKAKSFNFPIKQVRSFIYRSHWKKVAKAFALQFRPDFVHCHDYNTLFLGEFCKKKFKSKVIYDNHEYFQDLSYLHRYPLFVRKQIANYERKALQSFVDEMVVVSPGIADAYKPLFRKSVNIIRNIPDHHINKNKIGIPEDVSQFLVGQKLSGRKLFLYLGTNSQKGRGIDFCFNLVSALPAEYGLVIFGPRYDSELIYLKQKANKMGIMDRFGAFKSIPIPVLEKISTYFYMGVSLIEPVYFSYKHSLPNKLFEYFSLGLPVLSSDIPDQADLVLTFNLGVVVPFDIQKAKEIILQTERNSYNPEIKTLFSWDSEKLKLVSVYQSVQ